MTEVDAEVMAGSLKAAHDLEELVMSAVVTRRRALLSAVGLSAVGMGAVSGLTACGLGGPTPVGVDPVMVAEAARRKSGRTRNLALTARTIDIDLAGTVVRTWAYGDAFPGTALRATAGDRVRVAFTNNLPEATSVHWHGLAIRNDMDGVPGLTTPEVGPGGTFQFDFVVPDSGTHWFHPHSGLQLDRGLYAPFIVDATHEAGGYEHEWVVILDDWTDGVGPSPEQIYAALVVAGASGSDQPMAGMGMGMGMSGQGAGDSGMGNMGGGDVTYPMYLINGRPPTDPSSLIAKPGQRVRLRIINAAADTIFNVALGDHDMRVTHTDGYPVQPVSTSSIQLGMGERYDAIVTLKDGVFPLVGQPIGKVGFARALVRTGGGSAPSPTFRPTELSTAPLTVDRLLAAAGSSLQRREPDTTQDLTLSGSMAPYRWTINGQAYDNTVPLVIRQGRSMRIRIQNHSMMAHPVHVHGHTFQIGPAGGGGPRKDTVLVPPMRAVAVDLSADNPGRWMVHCHNAYHAQAGMMTRLDYTT